MSQENLFMLHAFEMGMFLAFVYDLFRLFRRVIPHGSAWIAAEDLVYWCICGSEVFWLLHRENQGRLRWFAVMAAMAGIWAYLRLGSPILLKYCTPVLKKLLTGIGGFVRIIGKGVVCHGTSKKKKEKSCISQASAKQGEHVFGDDGGSCHRGRDRSECHRPSEEDRCQ